MTYSFNKDYSSLSSIYIPFDIYNRNFNKILGTSNTVSSSALYTGDMGGIYAVPNFLSADSSVSDTDFFVDFGDGTIIENNLSAFHVYEAAGNYQLTLVVANSAGHFFRSLESFNVSVKDPVPDKIFISKDSDKQYESESTIKFYLTRFNSLKTSQELSANDYRIKLSVNGNNSPLENESNYLNNENFQYQNKSFFFTTPDNNFEVINNLKTNNTPIYGKMVSEDLVLTTLSAEDNVLVGTSGFSVFRYFEPTV